MKEQVALGRGCEHCGEPLFTTTPNNHNPKRYCSNECRYADWQQRTMDEMVVLAKKLARIRS